MHAGSAPPRPAGALLLLLLASDIMMLGLLALPLVGLAIVSAAPPTRVLFIGNSFTFVNDLPHQLVNIAN